VDLEDQTLEKVLEDDGPLVDSFLDAAPCRGDDGIDRSVAASEYPRQLAMLAEELRVELARRGTADRVPEVGEATAHGVERHRVGVLAAGAGDAHVGRAGVAIVAAELLAGAARGIVGLAGIGGRGGPHRTPPRARRA